MRAWGALVAAACGVLALERASLGRDCFGGAAEAVASGLGNPRGLLLVGHDLYVTGESPRRIDLRTRRVTATDRIPEPGPKVGRSADPELESFLRRPGAVLEGGFLYYHQGNRRDGVTIVRRRFEAGSREQTLAKLRRPIGLAMAVAGRRLFYVDDQAIWSVPVDAAAPPVRLAETAEPIVADLLAEPGCVYWADRRTIRRLALDRPGTAVEILADEETYQPETAASAMAAARDARTLATDGRFLYWTDPTRGRVMRARRDPRPMPPRPELVASWTGGAPRLPPTVQKIVVGDGWGCVLVGERDVARWQCWDAAPPEAVPPPRVAARDVPWLIGTDLSAGPDRLCAKIEGHARCWRWPELAERRPADMPQDRAAWGNLVGLNVGGTFTCTSDSGVWSCFGEDGFGQLGDGTPGVGLFGEPGALGMWHGCLSVGPVETFCWGRGDGLQLGFAPGERCAAGVASVACSRTAHQVPFKLPERASLFAGDLFTCARAPDGGLTCWGASRDGLFGTAAACPAFLLASWPTRRGPVAAPRATCAREPSRVTGLPPSAGWPSVGPRGICAAGGPHTRCVGAIPSPVADVANVQVSRGDQANACGLAGTSAVCWGAGYSAPGNPGALVPVDLDRPSATRAAVLDQPPPNGSSWEASCNVHFGCDQPSMPLPACPAPADAESWSDLAARATGLEGKNVRVRGPLALGPIRRGPPFRPILSNGLGPLTAECAPGRCCARTSRPVVIGGGPEKLALAGKDCEGDDSRVCCGVPALGQEVIVRGVLRGNMGGGWQLVSSDLCELRAAK